MIMRTASVLAASAAFGFLTPTGWRAGPRHWRETQSPEDRAFWLVKAQAKRDMRAAKRVAARVSA